MTEMFSSAAMLLQDRLSSSRSRTTTKGTNADGKEFTQISVLDKQ
jgi:hypothetical protein